MARPRLPTAEKELRGTLRPHRENLNAPKLERAIPTPPAKLTASGKLIWQQVAQLLDGMGVLTLADTFALEALAHDLAELRAARAALKKRGASTYASTSRDGSVMYRAFPEVAIISDLDRRIAAWLPKLGLTPESRSKVSTLGAEAPGNPFEGIEG